MSVGSTYNSHDALDPKRHVQYSDAELYAMLKGGDSRAHFGLSKLYERYSARVYSYCRKILGDIQKMS